MLPLDFSMLVWWERKMKKYRNLLPHKRLLKNPGPDSLTCRPSWAQWNKACSLWHEERQDCHISEQKQKHAKITKTYLALSLRTQEPNPETCFVDKTMKSPFPSHQRPTQTNKTRRDERRRILQAERCTLECAWRELKTLKRIKTCSTDSFLILDIKSNESNWNINYKSSYTQPTPQFSALGSLVDWPFTRSPSFGCLCPGGCGRTRSLWALPHSTTQCNRLPVLATQGPRCSSKVFLVAFEAVLNVLEFRRFLDLLHVFNMFAKGFKRLFWVVLARTLQYVLCRARLNGFYRVLF